MATVSPIGRVSHPHIFKLNDFGGKKNYQVTMLFDKGADLSELKAAAERAARAKWGDNPPAKLRSPFLDGDEKGNEYEGMTYIRFKRPEDRGQPQIVNADKQPIVKDSGEFYAGCHARVSYSCFAWEKTKGEGGVSFSLGNVQKIRDDTAFDGRTTADQDFDALEKVDDADIF